MSCWRWRCLFVAGRRKTWGANRDGYPRGNQEEEDGNRKSWRYGITTLRTGSGTGIRALDTVVGGDGSMHSADQGTIQGH